MLNSCVEYCNYEASVKYCIQRVSAHICHVYIHIIGKGKKSDRLINKHYKCGAKRLTMLPAKNGMD